jgi:hypothetical protein
VLALALLDADHGIDALTLTSDALSRIPSPLQAAAEPYFDAKRELSRLMDVRSEALYQLARNDEAVTQLQQALESSVPSDQVSQRIDLAMLLCTLNRPAEALALLPAGKELSGYGRMQMEKVRLMAATEQADTPAADRALSYLREHQIDSPTTLEASLLWAGRVDEAAQYLVSRLEDPGYRGTALLEVQEFVERPAPPPVAQWRARLHALRDRPEMRAAVKQVGSIDRYALTSPII